MARIYRQVGKVQVVEPLRPRAEPPLVLVDLEAPGAAAVRDRVRVSVVGVVGVVGAVSAVGVVSVVSVVV